MSQELAQHEGTSPFNRMLSSSVNAGSVTIEAERAIAEARGQMQLAKMFPRSVAASISEFLESCKSMEFAATAFYSVPNRGSGPSIRFAEEAARCYGNFEYGHRELSRSEGKSEIEVFAWDKEKNNRSTRQITVVHVLDAKTGSRKLTDQADIDNKIANVASKQIRGRILALLPKHLVAIGIAACKRTLGGGNEKPLSERIVAMSQAFLKYGITTPHLTDHLGHSLDTTTTDELADLIGIYNALKDGAKPSEYFKSVESDRSASVGASITAAAHKAAEVADTGTPAPAAQTDQKAPTTKPAKTAQKRNSEQQDGNSVESNPPENTQKSARAEPAQEPPAPTPPATDDVASDDDGEDVF